MRRPVSVRISSLTRVAPASKASLRASGPAPSSGRRSPRACRPRMEPCSMPRKRRAASETSTARPSAVNSRMPSCRLPRIWSRFSFNAEKTSSTLRMRWPNALNLVETRSAMSCLGGSSFRVFLAGLAGGRGPVVELHADLFHRPQRQVAQQESRNQCAPSTKPISVKASESHGA
jgi:hypothetical protein